MTVPSGATTRRSMVCSSRLSDQRWRSNGKDKRFWRHAFMGKMFQARTGLVERDFMGNGFQKFPDLFVGGSWNLLVLSLAQLFGQLLELHILVDRHDRGADWLGVELANQLLQLGMQCSLSMI